MKNFYTMAIVALLNAATIASAQVPDKATPIQQLNAACKANPSHEICQARQAKKDKATQSRETRVMRQVDAVLGAQPSGSTH
jgi:hypothetical protein